MVLTIVIHGNYKKKKEKEMQLARLCHVILEKLFDFPGIYPDHL